MRSSRDRVSLHDDDYRLWSIAALLLLNILWTGDWGWAFYTRVHRSALFRWKSCSGSVIAFFFFFRNLPLFLSRGIYGCSWISMKLYFEIFSVCLKEIC